MNNATTSQAFKPAILIPVYNHEHAIGEILEAILVFGYPILLVDDGSDAACEQALIQLQQNYSDEVSLIRLPQNGGKGAAVKAGLIWLNQQGFTHALQVDADGQHDLEDVELFMNTAKQFPQALVTGYPEYDASVPKLRFYSRYLTHIWIWINTLSLQVKDSMCGYRVYPVALLVKLLAEQKCGNRMEFDPEIMVRWVWEKGVVKNLPTKVHYPIDGVSHFNLWKDNVLITGMHTRLFFGMLWRLPRLLWQKCHD
ncbi:MULTISPECIES: glycosyltransferase family 2 protein [unclassified Methylophaga]|uniref:glycosyltransferase family 2 protein n=1 Tax=unclassified Methylophaga TaxID=2629249 RepID=UPI000C936D32|nr:MULTISPECIES: glycosyltransferase family 2 protein [unclassified Methylophaga]MBN45773.1 glycosyl transferase [Methylophaga sp.]|tara:strand:+ start:99365 stop:100129 length:765 start_codon:yes stop_codon:yes gene_type:complete